MLYEKINLFERVVGELDDILAKLELPSLEEHVSEILLHSDSEGEVRVKMDHLSAIINDISTESDHDEEGDTHATATHP